MRRPLALLALLCLAPAAPAAVQPAAIFSDGMVLQRDMPVPVWGTAAPGEEVTVTFGTQKKTTKADGSGKWRVTLDQLKAGGPHELVLAGTNKVTIDDVLVGEVWLCSGQSNMVWKLHQSENGADVARKADFPRIRYNAGKSWQACTPKAAPQFSACAYYFGRDLHAALGVPIGLVNRSVGGTSARLWTAREAMEREPGLKPFLPAILGKGEPKDKSKDKTVGNAGKLYEAHIRPLETFAIRGTIWYQGESDAARADEYSVLFPTLIRSWRKAWGQGDFPFLYVQLAPIKGRTGWELLREAQTRALALPKTGMAVILDGDVGIHPLKKQLPGARLARVARAVAYGEKDLVHSGPTFESVRFADGKAVVKFANVGTGLTAKGDRLDGFSLVADGKSFDAEARIVGDTVVVSSKDAPSPTAVRYAWGNSPKCSLFNKEGLPAGPFRSDGKK